MAPVLEHITMIKETQGIQSTGSMRAINLPTSGLFTANAMWTHLMI